MKEKATLGGESLEGRPWANETMLLFIHLQAPAQKTGTYFTQAQHGQTIKNVNYTLFAL